MGFSVKNDFFSPVPADVSGLVSTGDVIVSSFLIREGGTKMMFNVILHVDHSKKQMSYIDETGKIRVVPEFSYNYTCSRAGWDSLGWTFL